MGKFKPVAMPITFDQLQNEFKPMLKSLGLDVHGIFSGTTKYVVNIFNNRNNCIGICEYKIPSALKLTILAMYNPTEFLSYCDIPVVSETNSQIDHPKHYKGKDNPYEVIKVIEAWELNFNLGNVLKYIGRLGAKDEEIQELEKALWYLQREINNRKNK